MAILYIVSTPIGNLSDITFRAIDTLKSVDFIISETPMITSRLLNHYEIKKPQIFYTDEKGINSTLKILNLLKEDKSLALTSDSGTPLISDPGFKLVREVLSAGHKVVPIPGPSAVISALSVSGLPTDKFTFVGFLPKKGLARNEIIKQFGELDATMVLYESPFRISKLLDDIYDVLGNRYVFVAREMTKIYEESIFGNIEEVRQKLAEKKPKGEFVLLVAKGGYHGKENL